MYFIFYALANFVFLLLAILLAGVLSVAAIRKGRWRGLKRFVLVAVLSVVFYTGFSMLQRAQMYAPAIKVNYIISQDKMWRLHITPQVLNSKCQSEITGMQSLHISGQWIYDINGNISMACPPNAQELYMGVQLYSFSVRGGGATTLNNIEKGSISLQKRKLVKVDKDFYFYDQGESVSMSDQAGAILFTGVDQRPVFAKYEVDNRVPGTWYYSVDRNLNDHFSLEYTIRIAADHPEALKAADAAVVRYVQSITTLENHRSSK